jgi:5,10-methylenetetrahydrofolate reductase
MRQQKGFAMSTPRISFEFFPPKTLEASFKLWETARALAPLQTLLARDGPRSRKSRLALTLRWRSCGSG